VQNTVPSFDSGGAVFAILVNLDGTIINSWLVIINSYQYAL
jgi:hypothetical protein